jgi:hypothetical protein
VANRALSGEGGLQMQEAFQNLLAAMLINESVYMPVNHYLIPVEMDGRMLFSELWVDPDAEDSSRNGTSEKSVRVLFKMDVQDLGLFDVIMTTYGDNIDVRISCPEKVTAFAGEIESAISGILEENELKPQNVVVRRMDTPVALTDVFPKIFEGKDSINVKV